MKASQIKRVEKYPEILDLQEERDAMENSLMEFEAQVIRENCITLKSKYRMDGLQG